MVKLIGEPLFQWDTGRKVSVTPAEGVEIQEVHFANTGDSKAIPIAVENGEANIPDVLLQTGKTVAAYAVEILDGRERAVYELFLPVRERPKPGDYVYTEAEMAISELEKLTAAAGEATKAAEDVAAELRQAGEKIDGEMSLRGGGRFGKYDAKKPGWKRILNIIRATSGTLNLGLVQPSLGYSMVQYAMLDIGGCVNFHNDTRSVAEPVIRQRMNHAYGEDNIAANRQAKITKVRIAYPKRDTTYPIPDADGDYESKSNPINCYVDVYLDFDPEWKNNGYDVTRSFIYNFSGMTDSHNCTAITEEMDATDIGMYGEELEYFEYELKEDTELDAEFNRVVARYLSCFYQFSITDVHGNVQMQFSPTNGSNIGTKGLHTQSSKAPTTDTNGNAITNNTALGWKCEANASCAFSAGVQSIAEAYGATAIGLYLRAILAGQTIFGKFNAYENNALKNVLFAIGNGTSDENRSNAFLVKQDGSVEIAGALSAGSIAQATLQKIVDAVFADDAMGDIETALDSIIAIQNELIGGEEQ